MNDLNADIWELLGTIVGTATGIIGAKALLRFLEQEQNKVFPNELLNVGDVSAAYRRGYVGRSFVESELVRMGLDDERQGVIIKLTETLLNATDNATLLYRGKITSSEFKARMSAIGFSEESANYTAELYEERLSAGNVIEAEWRGLSGENKSVDWSKDLTDEGLTKDRIDLLRMIAKKVATPGDIFNFQAWNVYDSEQISRFKLDQGKQATFYEDMQANGIDADLADKMYASHWTLPPAFILKNLFQTGQITPEELTLFLRVIQHPPGFIDSIVKAFYKYPTEGQITDLLKEGVITDDQLTEMIKHVGYSPDDVPRMKTLIKARANNPQAAERTRRQQQHLEWYGLTFANVVNAYKDKIIDRVKADEYLKDIGEPEDVRNVHLSLADHDIAVADQKEEIESAHDRFISGELDYNAAIAELSLHHVTDTQQNHLLRTWQKEAKRLVKLPTKAELDKFVEHGIITLEAYGAQLSLMGYSDYWIEAYIVLLSQPKTTATKSSAAVTS